MRAWYYLRVGWGRSMLWGIAACLGEFGMLAQGLELSFKPRRGRGFETGCDLIIWQVRRSHYHHHLNWRSEQGTLLEDDCSNPEQRQAQD